MDPTDPSYKDNGGEEDECNDGSLQWDAECIGPGIVNNPATDRQSGVNSDETECQLQLPDKSGQLVIRLRYSKREPQDGQNAVRFVMKFPENFKEYRN